MKSPEDTNAPFKLLPDKRFVSSITVAVSFIGALIVGTWVVRGYAEELTGSIRDLRGEVQQLRQEMAHQSKRAWLYEEQISWVTALDREFRRSEYNIPPATKFRSTP